MVFWDDVFKAVAKDYPEIAAEQQLIDSLAARFVAKPESLDVIVASNLFGDILSDLALPIAWVGPGLGRSRHLFTANRCPVYHQAEILILGRLIQAVK